MGRSYQDGISLKPRSSQAERPMPPGQAHPHAPYATELAVCDETIEIIQRVAALDVGKAELTCCVRVPSPGKHGRRAQEVRSYQTMTRWLLVMADRLRELGVTRVVMEATSDYWKGAFYLLEAHGFETW